MPEEYTEYELRVLQKIYYSGRFCPHKHWSRDHIINGLVPKSDYGVCDEAVNKLIKKGFLSKYKAGDRDDLCVVKSRYIEALAILESYKEKYDFINIGRLTQNMTPHAPIPEIRVPNKKP
jgi:hypothetical protein